MNARRAFCRSATPCLAAIASALASVTARSPSTQPVVAGPPNVAHIGDHGVGIALNRVVAVVAAGFFGLASAFALAGFAFAFAFGFAPTFAY